MGSPRLPSTPPKTLLRLLVRPPRTENPVSRGKSGSGGGPQLYGGRVWPDDFRAPQIADSPEVIGTEDRVTLDPIGRELIHRQIVKNLGSQRLSSYGVVGLINLNRILIGKRNFLAPPCPLTSLCPP